MTSSSAELIAALSAIVGAEHVLPLEKLGSAKRSQILAGLVPDVQEPVVVYPRDQDQLASVVAYARQHQWRLLICGHRSKLGWGQPARDIDVVVSTQWLNRVLEHAVGDLTVTVEAGVPLAALQTILANENQFLALDPSHAEHATIGGIIATQDSGPLRHRYGGVRDMVLGVSLVRSDGELAKAGGRVVKNVAGYDLMKLLTGSFGTLGVISQATLRLYPLPEASTTVLFAGAPSEIQDLTQSLINSTLTPTAVEVLTHRCLEPYDLEGDMGLAVRFQGIAEGVEAQCDRIHQLSNLPPTLLKADQDTAVWAQFQQQLWHQATVVCKVGVLPAQCIAVLQEMAQSAQQQGVELLGQFHAGSGLGFVRLDGDVQAVLVEELRSHCQQTQGFLTVLEAPPDLKSKIEIWGYTGNALSSMRKIKEQFDPQALLNPGRFVEGL